MINNKPNIKPFVLLTLLIIVIVAVVTAAALYISRNQIVNLPTSVSNPVSLPVSNVVSEPVSSVVSEPVSYAVFDNTSTKEVSENIPSFDYTNYQSYQNDYLKIRFKAPVGIIVTQTTTPIRFAEKTTDSFTAIWGAINLKENLVPSFAGKDVPTPTITFKKDDYEFLKIYIPLSDDESDAFCNDCHNEYEITTPKGKYVLFSNHTMDEKSTLIHYYKFNSYVIQPESKSIWIGFSVLHLEEDSLHHKAQKVSYDLFKTMVSIKDSIEQIN